MARPRLLVMLFAGVLFATPAAARTQDAPDCLDARFEFDVILPNDDPFHLQRIDTLFRFHREAEALRKLDAARAIARGPWRGVAVRVAAGGPRASRLQCASRKAGGAIPRVAFRPCDPPSRE